jgi:hypothetical protein
MNSGGYLVDMRKPDVLAPLRICASQCRDHANARGYVSSAQQSVVNNQ